MIDIRKLIIIFIIAVLFSGFVFTFVEAIYPHPKYEDYCKVKQVYYPPVFNKNCTNVYPSPKLEKNCSNMRGVVEPIYDNKGCVKSFKCNTCRTAYRNAIVKYKEILFFIETISGILAVILSIYLPINREISKWIGSGFLLGGLFNIFIGTVAYINEMSRWLRPITLLIELLLIIYLAYKKMDSGNEKTNKPKKSK